MKYSEKMSLLLKGVKMSEIAELEKQEAEELAALSAGAEGESTPPPGANPDNKAEEETKTALQAALDMVKDLETKLQNKDDELTKLNQEFVNLANKQTVSEVPEKTYNSTNVMYELFHPKKKEE